MGEKPALVWLRQDLRLADNPALEAAMERRSPVIPVFIWSPEDDSPWAPGAASRWWLHQSLQELQRRLIEQGSNLVIRRGPAVETLLNLATVSGAHSVFWNRTYEPATLARDRRATTVLREHGLGAESLPGNLLFEPGTILNSSGKPFQVFTAFWKACLAAPAPSAPKDPPKRIAAPAVWPDSLTVSDLGLEPEIDWAAGLRRAWRPGEPGGMAQIRTFLSQSMAAYPLDRDRPDRAGTSRLSPHLHFGEVTPRQLWDAVHRHMAAERSSAHRRSAEAYLRQIVWREFAHHLLFHYPQTALEPLRPEFRSFPWSMDAGALKAWTTGKTGYPLVDAGMRELWQTGWMHNRIRMVAASFLVKHLLIPWQEGAAWFWDTLVDADLANNTMGWQWTAGCGSDAAPYFRIFNPVLQGEKFDPDGDYVRRWVPELARLPKGWIHQPWKAPAPVRIEAGIELGRTYPYPIVAHEVARERALAALASIKQRGRY
jgi:deoxyribodipyrimidine photo-lyase